MVPGEFVLRTNGTDAPSGVFEDVPRAVVDNSSWLDKVNIQQYWIVK